MSEKYFDQQMRSVLENLEPEYDASSWPVLERKLAAASAGVPAEPADAVDQAVLPTLRRLEAPFQSTHWSLLAQRLNTQAFRLRRLRVAKIAEAALLLLVLWNAGFFLDNASAGHTFPRPLHLPNVPVAGIPEDPRHRGNASVPHVVYFSPALSDAANGAALDLLASPGTGCVLSNDYTVAPAISSLLHRLNGLVRPAQTRVYAVTALLPCDALAFMAVPKRPLAFAPIEPYKPVASGPFYLAASVSGDQNQVLVNGIRRASPGYGATLAVGFRPGVWGVEAGLGYAHKRYTPKREVEIYSGNLTDGYFGSTLTEVSAGQVTLPLKVTRRIARLGKTSLHAVAGLTANITAEKTYDYGTVYFAPDMLPPNFLPDPNQSPKLRQSGRGILENGRLAGNVAATIDAGLRLERPIAGSRFTAFIEPAFRQNFAGKGLGPRREPINTLSIQAGVMAYL